MAPSNGEALLMLTMTTETSLEDAANKTLQNYKLTLIESKKENINGLPSIIMVADQKQEQGTIRVLSSLIQFEGKIFSIMGIAELSKFNNYQPSFLFTSRNFKELTSQEKLNKKPDIVRIKTVPEQMTLEAALKHFNMPSSRFEELAILNGMMLKEQLLRGSLIKTVSK